MDEEKKKKLVKEKNNKTAIRKLLRKLLSTKLLCGIIVLLLLLSYINLNKKLNSLDDSLSLLKTENSFLKSRIDNLEKEIQDLRLDMVLGKYEAATIDLTDESFQKIDNNFSISVEGIESHLSGMKIKGKILNSSGVTHKNVELSIAVEEGYKSFTIHEEISPGWARDFEVYIPDVPPETRSAEISNMGSTLSFHVYY